MYPSRKALLFFYLLHVASGDIFDRVLPLALQRFDKIRQIVVPIRNSEFEEAMFTLGSYYIPVDGKSELCRNHSNLVLDRFMKKEMWALRMVDASSKIPSGVLDGHFMDLGSYDQCLNLAVPGNIFKGQHCIVETRGVLPDDFQIFNSNETVFPSLRMDVVFSVCVPSSCSAEDVTAHMNVGLGSLNVTTVLSKDSCSSKISEPLSVAEWAATLVIILLLAVSFLGTVHDVNQESDKNLYLTAFSLKSNLPKMLSTKVPASTITCLNGLRVFGLCWVFWSHKLMLTSILPNVRFLGVAENLSSLWTAPIESAMLSVDVFFFMTGLLVTYGHLRQQQRGQEFNLKKFWLLRYLRLTPSVAFVVMLFGTLAIRLTDGPMWRLSFGNYRHFCQTNWWSTLLYIHNYVTPLNMCMPHTWYLACDFQMYVLSPLLLIPLPKKPKMGMWLIGLFLVLTTVTGIWNAYHLQLRAGGINIVDRRTEKATLNDFLATHVRAVSFLIGVAMGVLIFKIKQGHLILKLKKAHLWAGWLISLFLLLFLVLSFNHFQQYEYAYNPWVEVTHQVFHRHLFTIALSWIVLVCAIGHGGIVNDFLSWRFFVPLARLTYGAYLIHLLLLLVVLLNNRAPGSQTGISLTYQFFGDAAFSYFLAIPLFLLVEAPSSNLVSIVFEGENNKSTKPAPEIPKVDTYKSSEIDLSSYSSTNNLTNNNQQIL